MPRGRNLTEPLWEKRHRAITILLYVMIVATIPYGIAVSMPLIYSPAVVLPSIATVVAARKARSRQWRSMYTTLGLFASASMYVYLAGGVTEAHFLYFVLVGVISLYQDWRPFLAGVSLVLFNHVVFGLIMPGAVFEMADSMTIGVTMRMALIHTVFLLASTVASIVAWKASEVQSFSDTLTSLPNRRLLSDHLERVLGFASAPGTAVLFLDLCGFKKVNDVYGHEAGDQLLVEVARRLVATCRREDMVARIGGDEFVIVMSEADEHAAVAEAERIARTCEAAFPVGDRSLRLGASIGIVVAASSTRQVTSSDMLRDADLAMYAAKREFGDAGGYMLFHQEMGTRARSEFELELDLATCVTNDELVLMFQPIVDMVSSRIIGAEALVRWRHPQRGLLAPMTFIPLAERSGDIIEIGRWVLEQAVRTLADWQRGVPGSESLHMHVNVSTHQLAGQGWISDVSRVLATEEIAAGCLVLEVTESALLGGERDRLILWELKRLGVRLALDDFGTGYSSLSLLAQLPVDDLKIDKSFTDDVPAGPNRALMAGVLALAGQVGLTPVVEGIEREEQVRELLAMGARSGQGFFYCKPISPEAFARKLEAQRSGQPTSATLDR
ncbi:MAG: putative signaling protein [Ilumatobacteraceae bacterium]|nr:putative signaling protein [Ilumatobacteraceae bacterium]